MFVPAAGETDSLPWSEEDPRLGCCWSSTLVLTDGMSLWSRAISRCMRLACSLCVATSAWARITSSLRRTVCILSASPNCAVPGETARAVGAGLRMASDMGLLSAASEAILADAASATRRASCASASSALFLRSSSNCAADILVRSSFTSSSWVRASASADSDSTVAVSSSSARDSAAMARASAAMHLSFAPSPSTRTASAASKASSAIFLASASASLREWFSCRILSVVAMTWSSHASVCMRSDSECVR
mmetsp:Transcript_7549/g.34184  ORF Transcript_7549/g.34184 Transcript_7549/m.34184 type:complete len:250 (-) Transcript_7549:4758-5507(-)